MRQRLPKLSDAMIRELCSGDLENSEMPEPARARNSVIGHLGVIEREKPKLAQSPEVGQADIRDCESRTVQLFEVLEPGDMREQLIGPAIVQIREHDIAEVINSYLIDDPSGPSGLPDPRVRVIIPLGVVDDPAAGLIDCRNVAALSSTKANDSGDPAQPAANHEDQNEQSPHGDREKGPSPAHRGRTRFGRAGRAAGFQNDHTSATVGHDLATLRDLRRRFLSR
jgi:hypothetical protein